LRRLSRSSSGAPELDARHVATRSTDPSGLARTTMLPNSSGVVSRPLVWTLSLELLVARIGRAPMRPTARLDVLRLDRRDDVRRRQVEADQALGAEPDAHGVVACVPKSEACADAGRAARSRPAR
jgi:hypothetical protein